MSQTKVTDAVRTVTVVDGAKITTGTIPEARITALAATKLTGTVADARLPATALNSNVDLTTLSANNLTSGTIADARFPATLPAISGANLTGVGVTGITSSANTTAISISADEEVTMPLQPCFNAKMSVLRANVTGNGTAYTMAFDTEFFDIGGNYNTSTYTFTAPITGKYLLTFQASFANNVSYNATYWSANLVTSNRTYSNWELDPSMDYRDWMSNMVVVTDMDASDTAHCTVGVAGVGSDAIRMDPAGQSSFTGVLLA